MISFSRIGLRLDVPMVGDIVTVKVKRQPFEQNFAVHNCNITMTGGMKDQANNPDNWKMNNLFVVRGINASQAVVEAIQYDKGKKYVWPIHLHEWYEASELADALGLIEDDNWFGKQPV